MIALSLHRSGCERTLLTRVVEHGMRLGGQRRLARQGRRGQGRRRRPRHPGRRAQGRPAEVHGRRRGGPGRPGGPGQLGRLRGPRDGAGRLHGDGAGAGAVITSRHVTGSSAHGGRPRRRRRRRRRSPVLGALRVVVSGGAAARVVATHAPLCAAARRALTARRAAAAGRGEARVRRRSAGRGGGSEGERGVLPPPPSPVLHAHRARKQATTTSFRTPQTSPSDEAAQRSAFDKLEGVAWGRGEVIGLPRTASPHFHIIIISIREQLRAQPARLNACAPRPPPRKGRGDRDARAGPAERCGKLGRVSRAPPPHPLQIERRRNTTTPMPTENQCESEKPTRCCEVRWEGGGAWGAAPKRRPAAATRFARRCSQLTPLSDERGAGGALTRSVRNLST